FPACGGRLGWGDEDNEGERASRQTDGRGAAALAKAQAPASGGRKVPAPATDWRVHRGFRLFRAPRDSRSGWGPACGATKVRRATHTLVGVSRLSPAAVLEQRCIGQYRSGGSGRVGYGKDAYLTPHLNPPPQGGRRILSACFRG